MTMETSKILQLKLLEQFKGSKTSRTLSNPCSQKIELNNPGTVYHKVNRKHKKFVHVCPRSIRETKLKNRIIVSVWRKVLGLSLKFVRGTSPVCFVPLSAQIY
jgi:hypothetical protein